MPTTWPCAPKIGTFARTDQPRVPCSMPTHAWPCRAGDGSVETRCPIWSGLGCEYRIPSVFATTTNEAASLFRMASAIGWITADGLGSAKASITSGMAATECPMASERFSYSSVTCCLTSEYVISALARTMAAMTATWKKSTWDASCRGRTPTCCAPAGPLAARAK